MTDQRAALGRWACSSRFVLSRLRAGRRFQGCERADLIGAHQARVARDIGFEDRSKSAFDARLGHVLRSDPAWHGAGLWVGTGACASSSQCSLPVICDQLFRVSAIDDLPLPLAIMPSADQVPVKRAFDDAVVQVGCVPARGACSALALVRNLCQANFCASSSEFVEVCSKQVSGAQASPRVGG